MILTQCVVAETVGKVVVDKYKIREPRDGEILVKVLYSAISPGTELRCLAGKEPNAGPFPMITGYSLVGQVIKGTSQIREGKCVFLNGTPVVPKGISSSWGGHIGHAVCTPDRAKALPDGMDLKCASALSMVSIALHGVCRANPQPGDCVLVTGQGLIGQLAAGILKTTGCRLAVCDLFDARLDTSKAMGASNVYLSKDGWHKRVRKDFPDGFDIVIDVTGIPQVVEANLPLLREKSWSNVYQPSPKLVLLGSYPGKISLDYQETLFNKETDIRTCRTYLPHELDRAVDLVAGKQLNLQPILRNEFPALRATDAFERLHKHRDKCLTAVLDWTEQR